MLRQETRWMLSPLKFLHCLLQFEQDTGRLSCFPLFDSFSMAGADGSGLSWIIGLILFDDSLKDETNCSVACSFCCWIPSSMLVIEGVIEEKESRSFFEFCFENFHIIAATKRTIAKHIPTVAAVQDEVKNSARLLYCKFGVLYGTFCPFALSMIENWIDFWEKLLRWLLT